MNIGVRMTASSPEALAELTLDAAIEVEALLAGQKCEIKALSGFVAGLRQLLEEGLTDARANHLYDPRAVTLYGRALAKSSDRSIKNVNDVKATIEQYVAGFDLERSKDEITFLKHLRDFCLAVHSELSSEIFTRSNAKRRHPRRDERTVLSRLHAPETGVVQTTDS